MTHLNLFKPYERKPAHYEDVLTRAFLITIRAVPLAHAAWLDLVDQAHRDNGGEGVPHLHELVAPEVYMQTARLPEEVTKVVSLIQTDRSVEVPKDAKESDRRQVLDGVINYGSLALVLENKPWHGHMWTGQLDVNIPPGTTHDPHVACVVWDEVILAWSRLLESGHLSTAEAVVVGDFLDYVESYFPALRPYSRVGLCGRDYGRLTRRCKAALMTMAGEEHVYYQRGWAWHIDLEPGQCARKIGLFAVPSANPPRLVLEFDPADTMGQAMTTYREISVESVNELLSKDRWRGWPNFHLMFMATGFFKPGHYRDLPAYWQVWTQNMDSIRQWKDHEFDAAWDKLLTLGMVAPKHREAFDQCTVNTKRGNVCFAPGATFQWWLPLDEAARLDELGELEAELSKAIEEGCEVLSLRRSWLRGES